MNRGRFPAEKPEEPQTSSSSKAQPLSSSPGASSSKQRRSISPPEDYTPPVPPESPEPPTTYVPDPDAGFANRQHTVDGYLAALAEKRQISDATRRRLIDQAECDIVRQLRNLEWRNGGADIKLSLSNYYNEGNAESQDFLLRKMGYTGWVWRNPAMVPQKWSKGTLIEGPGLAAREQARAKRAEVSPYEV